MDAGSGRRGWERGGGRAGARSGLMIDTRPSGTTCVRHPEVRRGGTVDCRIVARPQSQREPTLQAAASQEVF